jgi:hypothetical protein
VSPAHTAPDAPAPSSRERFGAIQLRAFTREDPAAGRVLTTPSTSLHPARRDTLEPERRDTLKPEPPDATARPPAAPEPRSLTDCLLACSQDSPAPRPAPWKRSLSTRPAPARWPGPATRTPRTASSNKPSPQEMLRPCSRSAPCGVNRSSVTRGWTSWVSGHTYAEIKTPGRRADLRYRHAWTPATLSCSPASASRSSSTVPAGHKPLCRSGSLPAHLQPHMRSALRRQATCPTTLCTSGTARSTSRSR